MKNLWIKYRLYVIGILLGAVGGFAYWYFIGCSSGTCPITSRWTNSTGYGMLIGALVASSINDRKKKNESKKENHEVTN